MSWPQKDARTVGAAVKLVLAGEHEIDLLEKRLRRVFDDASKIAEAAQAKLDQAEAAGLQGALL